MPIIKLKTNDDKVFEVDFEIAKCSTTIRTMVENLGLDDDDQEIVPIPNVNGPIMDIIIQWATHHKDDPPFNEEAAIQTDDISSWDADFLNVEQGTLFEIILATNYLDVRGLLYMACKTIANMIKGKSPEEIRTTFNIKNDLTAEEEDQLRREDEWCKSIKYNCDISDNNNPC